MTTTTNSPSNLSESQNAVLQKYLAPGETTWEHVARRVCREVAKGEATQELRDYWEAKFFEWIYPMKFVPAGSVLANAGHGTGGCSNCFVLSSEDNIHDITQLVSDSTLTTKFRGGVGINIGSRGEKGYIREKGEPFSDGQALGACSVLDMVSENSSKITTGNRARRGAFLFSMSWRHGEIMEFIKAKHESKMDAPTAKRLLEEALNTSDESEKERISKEFETAWVESHLNPEGTRERRWHNANISVQLDAEFFELLDEGDEHVTKLWDAIAENAHATADPGLLMMDNMRGKSPLRDHITSTNPCFAAGTMVATRDGHYPIEELVGKTVEIFDGDKWVEIDNFRVTGTDQKMLRVTLHSGQTMDVTPYHKFILEDGTRIEAQNLKKGQKLKNLDVKVKGRMKVKAAYAKGFLLGDGHVDDHARPHLNLHGNKVVCIPRLFESLSELEPIDTHGVNGRVYKHQPVATVEKTVGRQTFTVVQGLTAFRDELLPWVSTHRERLPADILNWDDESKAEFIAGYFDSDGNARDGKNGYGYQISSIHLDALKDFQLLLFSIGVQSKLSLMKKAESKDFGANGGICQTKDCYRISLSQKDSLTVSSQVRFSRLDNYEGKTTTLVARTRYHRITEINETDVADKVYCCTVPQNHSFLLSNGVLTVNCGELPLPPNSSCDLGSIVISRLMTDGALDLDALREITEVSVRFLDDVLTVSTFATESQRRNCQEVYRQQGLGIMGLSDYLKSVGIPYASDEHLAEADRIGAFISDVAYRASEALAVEKGPCGVWPEIAEVKTGNPFERWVDGSGNFVNGEEALNYAPGLLTQVPRRNATVLSIAPTGSIAQLAGCSWAIEPDFGLVIWKQVFVDASKGKQNWVPILSPYLEGLGLSEADQEIVKSTGFLKGTEFAKENPDAARVFETAQEISPEWHIRTQAAWQRWVDSSISKTTNLPATATVEDIKAVYRLAHKLGIKGTTIYRSGTLDSEPIKVGAIEEEKAPKTDAELVCPTGKCGL